MKPNTVQRLVNSSSVISSSFGISSKDEAHVMGILRDSLYTDKILAVIREYSSNAYDAHNDIGKSNVPIEIILPTCDNLIFSVRDFGKGLSKDEIFTIFTQYGASTKRGDNLNVGMLGIGAKSGFAYVDSFTIVSYCNGIKSTYIAVIDESEKGRIDLLQETPCGNETGLLIEIGVAKSDVFQFEQKAKEFYKYFSPTPNITSNILLDTNEFVKLNSGIVDSIFNGRWVALMGCVSYKIDSKQFYFGSSGDKFNKDIYERLGGCLLFNIGDIEISASREEIRYSKKTKEKIIEKFNTLVDEYTILILSKLDRADISNWSKRIELQKVSFLLSTDINNSSKLLLDSSCSLLNKDGIRFFKGNKVNEEIDTMFIREGVTLVLRDTRRPIHIYSYPQNASILVVGKDINKIESEVAEFCKEKKIEGIPIIKLSKCPISTVQTKLYKPNKKFQQKRFVLKNTNKFNSSVRSSDWDIVVDKEPSKDDVYVFIRGFKSDCSIFPERHEDSVLAKTFSVELPPLYGYKNSGQPIIGTHYSIWRKTFLKQFIEKDAIIKEIATCVHWAMTLPMSNSEDREYSLLINLLPKDHLITQFINTQKEAIHLSIAKDLYSVISILKNVGLRSKGFEDSFNAFKDTIEHRYPLFLLAMNNLRFEVDKKIKTVVDYITLIDENLKLKKE